MATVGMRIFHNWKAYKRSKKSREQRLFDARWKRLTILCGYYTGWCIGTILWHYIYPYTYLAH